jgi:hypothetical protein
VQHAAPRTPRPRSSALHAHARPSSLTPSSSTSVVTISSTAARSLRLLPVKFNQKICRLLRYCSLPSRFFSSALFRLTSYRAFKRREVGGFWFLPGLVSSSLAMPCLVRGSLSPVPKHRPKSHSGASLSLRSASSASALRSLCVSRAVASNHGSSQCVAAVACGLTLPSSGRAPAGVACLRTPLMSNVRRLTFAVIEEDRWGDGRMS